MLLHNIMTGNYNGTRVVPAGMRAVGISQGVPKWFAGVVDRRLAPSWTMLKLPREEYDARFMEMLVNLDPQQIAEELNGAVLVCWEAPIIAGCHRRIVAEWLETALGIVVREVGFERGDVPSYRDTPWEVRAPKKKGSQRRFF